MRALELRMLAVSPFACESACKSDDQVVAAVKHADECRQTFACKGFLERGRTYRSSFWSSADVSAAQMNCDCTGTKWVGNAPARDKAKHSTRTLHDGDEILGSASFTLRLVVARSLRVQKPPDADDRAGSASNIPLKTGL